ncbi:ankyrin repeat and SAM domain-containing protein 6-like [Abrus precatorius]|uniref:Ankyrin repeat and SAM domain-containing protein 6-like n=1 Tax=Abrus precatorius TaxID=3816 RepID=A0A8B8K6F4_ABRPR|nr:ankyrin repeat and SAM domain-containing protein 6-like [Abrus precatorius]
MADVPPPEGQMNGGGTAAPNSSETLGSKRQRRPSVRLGDIGDQPYDSHPRRTTAKPWRLAFDHNRKDAAGKPSKTRPLTNLTSAAEFGETLESDGNMDSVVIGSWKVKDSKKRGSKRVRSNWISRIDGEDVDDGYHRDFDVEASESPLKEQSPFHSMENLGVDGHGHGNDRDVQHYHDRNGNGGRGEDGVRIWLNGLGLGRYAPVFEIHEVDDEVLPLLTLEDLKDMGINAVGSRRKMYCAIQKLGKGFS